MTDRKGILGRSFTGAKGIAIIKKDTLTGHEKLKKKADAFRF